MSEKLTAWGVILIILYMIVIIVTIGGSGMMIGDTISNKKHNAQIEVLQQEIEYHEMMTLYLEAKADYYETIHNIDLDDTDDGFILYMIREHPDVYVYFMEREGE